MHFFDYKNDILCCEDVPIPEIAEDVGTPFYLYSRNTLQRHYQKFEEALSGVDHIICYAIKANPSLAICKLLADEGAGADVVSGGELARALHAGIPSQKIVFNGNGKTEEELTTALEADILMFNVDSESELQLLNRLAGKMGRKARVALRVNPDINPRTHPYISTGLKENKFGVAIENAIEYYQQADSMPNIEIVGIHKHIGSQIVELSPFVDSLERVMSLVKELTAAGLGIRYIDMGGGIGITYDEERPPSFEEYVGAVRPMLNGSDHTLIVEPGRVIVGNAGILVTRVSHIKKSAGKNFVVVDAAMNDLIRPSIYSAYHKIIPVERQRNSDETVVADVVGGICESTDFFAKGRELPRLEAGELIAIMSAGAYGSAMASNYNSRPLIAEVMASHNEYRIVRRRQTFKEMIALESF